MHTDTHLALAHVQHLFAFLFFYISDFASFFFIYLLFIVWSNASFIFIKKLMVKYLAVVGRIFVFYLLFLSVPVCVSMCTSVTCMRFLCVRVARYYNVFNPIEQPQQVSVDLCGPYHSLDGPL